MGESCDDILYNTSVVNSSYTACSYIRDHMDDCEGESIVNYRLIYFCW
jgi:hypothetical protein